MPENALDDAPGCAAFESTLALVDGLARGLEADRARAHARDCAVCGPLVAGWPKTSAAFVAAFEDAAERAKPGLADLANRVLDRVQPKAPAPAPSPWERLARAWRRLQAPVALAAAAAAVAIVVAPLVSGPGPANPAAEAEDDASVADALPAAPPAGPNDLHMHSLAFGPADGMVFRTSQGQMTVIWVSEKPKA